MTETSSPTSSCYLLSVSYVTESCQSSSSDPQLVVHMSHVVFLSPLKTHLFS